MKKTLIMMMLGWSILGYGQLKKLFDREAQYEHFNGVVLVKGPDSLIFQGCYGSNDERSKIHLNTRFDIGSITKQFTAAGILHLVYENKLQLHDPINNYLGPNASDRWKKVTIHQLLTHTGGVPSLYQTEQGLEIFYPQETSISLSNLIARFREAKLLFSPGEEFSYSNSGYILLAAIIEQVTGSTYENFMQSIFDKYGLTNTSFEHDVNAAIPYYGYRKDMLKKAPVYHSSWFIGAGGVYSSAKDLSKWVEVINSQSFLNEKLRNKFLSSHTNQGYGYGWQFADDLIQHDGGNAGFISFLSFNPSTLAQVIVLTNRSFEDISMFGKSAEYVRQLVSKSWDALNQDEIEVLPAITKGPLMEGIYEINDVHMSIAKSDTSLTIVAKDTYPSRIVFNTPLEPVGEINTKLLEVANYLEKGKYWTLAKHCDGEMKFVMYSGLMSVGMRMMKKKVGKLVSIIPYGVENGNGLLRMKGTEGILDLIVYFDDEDKIQGIFENGSYGLDKEVEMTAYPIGKNLYYLDGLPFGEKSATMRLTNQRLTVYQLGRSVEGTRK